MEEIMREVKGYGGAHRYQPLGDRKGEGVEGSGFGGMEESVGLSADLLWGPVVETLQLFLPPSFMSSIKYWHLEICAWHSPHISKLGTDVVVPLLQILHRTLLRMKAGGGNKTDEYSEARGRDCIKVVGLPGLGVVRTCKYKTAHLELLVVIPVMDDYKTKVKAATEVKEVISFCLSPSVIMKIQLVLLL